MASRSTEKMIDALTQLLEGFSETQESIEEDYITESEDDDEDEESSPEKQEAEGALVAQVKTAVESVMEAEDYSAEEIATLLSAMTEALEEIDPDVFEDDETDEQGALAKEIAEEAEKDDDYPLDDDEEFDYDDDDDEEEEEEDDDDDESDDEDEDDDDLDEDDDEEIEDDEDEDDDD